MLITLFTDASFSRAHKVATWAVWFVCDNERKRFSGQVRGTITQSGDGELAAIANGLWLACKHLTPPPGASIIIQTDSQEAITALRLVKHPRPYAMAVVSAIHQTAKAHGLYLDLRHVRGHQGTTTKRSTVNTWCDRAAKNEMGKLLAQIKAERRAKAPELKLELKLKPKPETEASISVTN